MSDVASTHAPESSKHHAAPKDADDAHTTRPKTRAPIDDESFEANAIVAGFRAAQLALEVNNVAIAQRHLAHVDEAAEKYGGTKSEAAVHRAADSFEQALGNALDRSRQPSKELEHLGTTNSAIRKHLGFVTPSTRSGYHKAGGSSTAHAKHAIPTVLRLIAVRAHNALALLDQFREDDKNHAIAELAMQLDESVGYVGWLLDQLTFPERASFGSQLDAAADNMHAVLTWIRTRVAHAAMEQRFLISVGAFDTVLIGAGRPRIEPRIAPALTGHEIESAAGEQRSLGAAQTHLSAVLDKVQVRQTEAINSFRQLAGAPDVEDTTFLTDLATSLFVAAIGHLGGFMIDVALGKAAARLGNAAKVTSSSTLMNNAKRLIQRTVDVSVDWIQGIAAQALGQTEHIDPQSRAREFFAAGMAIEVVDRIVAMKQNIANLVAESAVTPVDLDQLRLAFEESIGAYYQAHLQHTFNAWTSYMAQSQLGVRRGRERDGRRVSKVNDYFGTQTPGGRVFGTSKQGTVGVLSIAMHVDHAGTRPKLERDATRIHGMNSAVSAVVLESASHKLERIWLPKEVHVVAGFGHAIIALDETNQIRDVHRWEEVRQRVGVETALQFWALYGKDVTL